MKDKLKEEMLRFLQLYNGIWDRDLALKIMGDLGPMAFTNEEFHEAYEELLSSGEIIRLEFNDFGHVKALLFRKGTQFLNLPEVGQENEQAGQTDMARTSR